MKTSMKTTMKTTMKFFAALAIMMGFTMAAMAQDQVPATNGITAKANVVAALKVGDALKQNLNFGNVLLTGSKTINLAGVGSGSANAGGSTDQGIISIEKSPSTAVNLTFTTLTSPLTIVGFGGTATLPIVYNATWSTSSTTGVGGETVNISGTGIPTPIPNTDTNSLIYVHIGGTVSPYGGDAAATIAGVYEGTITLSVEYN